MKAGEEKSRRDEMFGDVYPKPLYRGVGEVTEGSVASRLLDLKPGDTFQQPLSATSTEREVAEAQARLSRVAARLQQIENEGKAPAYQGLHTAA